MNLEGRLLGGRYEIIEKIGNGGMATVYKAKCLVLKRYVAVKILRDEYTTDEEFIKRFNIEAESVASLTHPNIVSVYDVGHEDNLYYIVMELVKGKTLKEIIIEDGILSWKWSVKIAIQIASALETAHKNNIIHRDIKPHNIIITEEGIAKVTDFGIAKAVSNSTITAFGTTIGSVHYFSPEHARGGVTDAKSDLYSLGVVLYEMVTGRVPFDADTPVSVALKHMQEEPTEPITINTDLPISVNQIIMKAMKKDANERYSSATEMIKDLNMALKTPDNNFVTEKMNTSKTIVMNQDIKQEISSKKDKKPGNFAKMKEYLNKHKGMKVLIIILVAILVFALSTGITLLALSLGRAKEVQIPDLANLTVEEATAQVNTLKLKIEVQEEKYDLEIQKGKIIEQDPKYKANYKIKEGTTIKLIVSKGQEIVKIPKVIGKTKDEANKELKDLGLEVNIIEENSDEIEKGYVIKQDIAENEEIPAGTKINITISTGIEQINVPDLSGKSEADAKASISSAKLKYKATVKTKDSSKSNGVIIDQSITPGSYVDKNTEITITLNEYEEVKSGTININVKSLVDYTEIIDEEGNLVDPGTASMQVTVNDESVDTRTVSRASTNETIRFDGSGTVEIKVYIDSNRKATKTLNLNESTSITID